MTASAPLRLAVALDGAGWHPAAWRDAAARPAELFTAAYWADLATEAEAGLVDFVTIEDTLVLQSARRGVYDERTDQLRGRLDAVLVAARVAPVTSAVGLVPVATTTHTEPFHVSKAIATLDFVSTGRAGVQVRISPLGIEARQFGRREIDLGIAGDRPPEADRVVEDLFDEAADFAEVLRRLWDSWEDGAEIRDVASGRFVDRAKLHYIDFSGRFFSVRGPSITPRPPQGQPIVAALAHIAPAYRLAARAADVCFVTPHDVGGARSILDEVAAASAAVERAGPPLIVLADLVVVLDDDASAARARLERLDELQGHPLRSDAEIFAGSPAELAELLAAWQAAGIDGFRLRPAVLPTDLEAISRRLVPLLQERSGFRDGYEAPTLRARLGLDRPVNRYVPV